MNDKLIAVVALGLSAASQAFIKHNDTATFFSVVLFAVGTYEFVLGVLKDRKAGL